jgi:phosphoribosylaminoimidazole (AIR) synthetase
MQEIGKIDQSEMLRATNMGIGMVCVVKLSNVEQFCDNLEIPDYRIGEIILGEPKVTYRT